MPAADPRYTDIQTHSALQTGSSYWGGGWSVECVVCHNPHLQLQTKYQDNQGAPGLDIAIGTVAAISTYPYATVSTLTAANVAFAPNSYVGYLLVPNTAYRTKIYRIRSNDATTLAVDGAINPAYASAGNTYAIRYGKLINTSVVTPRNGIQGVRFLTNAGPSSFGTCTDPLAIRSICQVCHTQTASFNNGGVLEGTGHPLEKAGTDCMICHPHARGFKAECTICHAATAETITTGSHQAHLSPAIERGPNGVSVLVTCDNCHGTGAVSGHHVGHLNGTVTFADGYALLDTNVCNVCHSPGGDYDGVADPLIGAKNNWTTGVYAGGDLTAGKEKWCAGCHDKSPSTIAGVPAPNVVGDETGSFTYGTGWGYYMSGHGLPNASTYPASGGVTAGAGQGCSACHDLSAAHIDGNARTFDDGGSSTLDPSAYRTGYRLKKVPPGTGTGASTEEPLLVPWPLTTGNSESNYRLCVTCHASEPFTSAASASTNMREGATNLHQYHLVRDLRYPPDWSGGNTSKMTCMSCHNVHGSTRLAMVRDGKLTNREPGFRIWYYNPDVVTYTQMSTNDPAPTNLGLAASTGSLYVGESAANLCSHCHAAGQTSTVIRTPYQSVAQAPVLSWTGGPGYDTDGVQPDSGPGGSSFAFRVQYSDANNDAPTRVELWVDRNDDGDYGDAGEMVAMVEENFGDANYTDGKLYAATLLLNKAGDDTLAYRFFAEQSGPVAATGEPTVDKSVIVTNAIPVLSWTGEPNYVSSGVLPLVGGTGATFEFRVSYADADNEAPSTIQIWVDRNDDADYEDAGEKIDMTKATGQDDDYRNGEIYTADIAIVHAGDGQLNYRFFATDGTADAAEDAGPVGNGIPNTLTVLTTSNTPPWLEWDSGGACLTDGVRPQRGPTGGDFEFRIKYVDWDNTPPGTIEVWVDKNDDGDYDDSGEKLGLLVAAGQDGSYRNGEIYTSGTVTTLAYAGDGNLNYRFHATDGTDAASSGAPVTSRPVSVVNTAFKVRPAGGTGWYSTIASAVTATTGNATILVYPSAAYTAATYGNVTVMSKPSVTIRSVCGPELTAISAGGGAVQGVLLQNGAGDALDGFTVTGGTSYGVYTLNASSTVISNCTVSGNPTGVNLNNSFPVTITGSRITGNAIRGINAVNGTGTIISGCEIAENGGGEVSGAGIYFNGGSHSVTDSILRNNRATGSLASSGNGGGIYFLSNTATTIANTIFSGNSAVKSGGGVYLNNASVDFYKCTMTGNSAAVTGGMFSTMTTTANIINSIIAGNTAPKGGAAYVNSSSANLTFVNDTIADNQATATTGGAFAFCNTGAIAVRNSIFWNNSAFGLGDNAYKECGSTNFLTVTDSDISTGPGSIDGGTITNDRNMDPAQDPLFIGSGDYHIRSGSPVVDKASAAYAPADDIDGDERPLGAADDMGADERE